MIGAAVYNLGHTYLVVLPFGVVSWLIDQRLAMAAATEGWIEAGLVNGRSTLKVAASIGDGHCLREAEWDRFVRPFEPFFSKVVDRSGSDAKVAKGMSKIMGMDLGPPRPPSVALDERELAELRALMVGWGWPVPGSSGAASCV